MGWILILIIILLLNIISFGQPALDEIDRLRSFLNIPQAVKITVAASDRISKDGSPLRVFLFTGKDSNARKFYESNVNRWNNSRDAKRYGSLALTDDLFSADVALVKQSFPEQARVHDQPVVTTAPVYDPASKTTVNRTTSKTYTIRAVPFKIHILRRSGNKIEILRSMTSVEIFRENDKRGTGDSLWEQFRELMKQ